MIKDLGRIVGLSAYEEAVKNGFDGTFEEWVETLKVKVANVTKTVNGNTNTVTLTFNDGSTKSFTVQNGKEITSITKRSSTATDSTLLVTYNDGTTETVTIPNGTGISSVEKIGTSGLVDTYRINFTDKSPVTFTVTNGNGIVSVEKTDTNGIIDTYTITYTDGTTSTFQLRNSIDTVSYDYMPEIITGRYLELNATVGETEPLFGDNFYTSGSADYGYVVIPVNAGQMFRLSGEGSFNRRIYSLLDSNRKVLKQSVKNVPLDSYKINDILVEVNVDGYLLYTTKLNNAANSIKKVTLFDEVERAIASIPDTDELVSAVIEALPRAEEGAF